MESLQEIKDLGRKARERLEEERQKRKEIVMLDQAPPEIDKLAKRSSISTFRVPSKKSSKPAPSTTPTTSKKRKRTPKNPEIDSWVASVSHIPTLSKDDRSTVVRMHSLPVGCTPVQIRRFFVGLNPGRIFVIPTNKVNIASLDESTTASGEQGRGNGGSNKKTNISYPIVDRYKAHFRVFVKFASAPMAAQATERSGEAIMLQNDEKFSKSKSTSNIPMKGATVAVTQVEKKLATFLLKTMVIDVIPKIPLHESLSITESNLHPYVCSTLWQSMAVRFDHITLQKQHLRHFNDKDGKEGSLILISNDKMLQQQYCNLTSLVGHQQVVNRHNDIVILLNEMLNQIPHISFDSNAVTSNDYSSSTQAQSEFTSRDPVLRLTNKACSLLRDETKSIQQMLHQSRITRLFEKQKVSK